MLDDSVTFIIRERHFHFGINVHPKISFYMAKVSVNNSQLVVTCCYLTMVFTVNLFSNDQSVLMVFFSLA